jgi:hypothetical protein
MEFYGAQLIPSGNLTVRELENDHIIVDFSIENGDFP